MVYSGTPGRAAAQLLPACVGKNLHTIKLKQTKGLEPQELYAVIGLLEKLVIGVSLNSVKVV